MLMIPNFVWSKNKPKEYDKYVKNENKVLEKELIGYADYKKKVKYKVIPFIWRT